MDYLRLSPLGAALVGVLLLAACSGGGAGDCGDEPGSSCVWVGTGEAGFNGDGHNRTETRLYWPVDIGFAPDGTPWVVDWNNHKIREVLPDGKIETVISLFHPTDIDFGPDGLIYIADWHNYRISMVDPETGLFRILGGEGAGFAGDGGPVDKALFNQPGSISFGPDGSLYILDQRNQRIRKVSPGANPTVTTVIGTGAAGFSGDGGPPALAQLNFESGESANPSGALTIGPDGNLYIADALNYRIRRVDFAANVIETIAGSGVKGFSGDGGLALQAKLSAVNDLEFGPDGRLYLADTDNNCIRAIDLDAGTISMVWNGDGTGDGLKGADRLLNRPFGIAFDPEGRLYIADTFNQRIIRVRIPI